MHLMRNVTLSVLLAAAAAAEPVELNLDLKLGDSFTQTMRTEQQIEQTVMGQSVQMDQVNEVTYTSEVLDRASDQPGGLWVATQYDRVVFEQSGPMGEMRYDSADPPRRAAADAGPPAPGPRRAGGPLRDHPRRRDPRRRGVRTG